MQTTVESASVSPSVPSRRDSLSCYTRARIAWAAGSLIVRFNVFEFFPKYKKYLTEPGTLALMAVGLLGLSLRRRRN